MNDYNSLYSLFENTENKNYKLLLDNRVITKKMLLDYSFQVENNLIKKIDISDSLISTSTTIIEDKKIYLSISNRLLFIALFIAFLRLKAKVVLLPVEVIIDEINFSDGIIITDDENRKFDLIIRNDFSLDGDIGKRFDRLDKFEEDKKGTFIYLYTSGSTGKPKLIPKSDINLITEIKELKPRFNITSDDTFYLTNPIYHIYGFLFGVLLPIYADSSFYLDSHFTPESISSFVKNNKISIFVSIPNYYNMFSNLNLVSNFTNCNKFFTSSAPLSLEVSKSFFEYGLSIIEIYGSTETGGIANRVQAASDKWETFSYIKILVSKDDELNNKLDDNELELLIDSPAISVNYDKNIGFNTNDLVELDENGNFRLLGRNNRFTKIGGKRVDLYFIRDKLVAYFTKELKRDVKADDIYIGEKDEKIYIFFNEKEIKKSVDIKKDLTDYLPSYSIPKYFFWEKIPTNILGKINKNAIDEIIGKVIK
jgi:acyl-coenzyme A synthetase/AMP-(fatty) acid ligase